MFTVLAIGAVIDWRAHPRYAQMYIVGVMLVTLIAIPVLAVKAWKLTNK